jgi:hypothetical protein
MLQAQPSEERKGDTPLGCSFNASNNSSTSTSWQESVHKSLQQRVIKVSSEVSSLSEVTVTSEVEEESSLP